MKFWTSVFIVGLLEIVGLSIISPRPNNVVAPSATPTVIVIAPSGPASSSAAKSDLIVPSRITHLEVNGFDTLSLTGEIGDNAEQLANQINDLRPSTKPLYLLIDSPGGSVLQGSKLVSAIESSRRPIYTVCQSLCASMAAIIHQYGVKRYMINRSILMFHEASSSAEGYVPHMLSELTMTNKLNHKMDTYIAKRSGQSPELFILKVGANNIWSDSDDSLKDHYSDGTIALHMNGRN